MTTGQGHPPTQSTIVIRHNNIRYFFWKIYHLYSLLWIHGKIVIDLTKTLIGFLIRGSRVWMIMSIRLLCFVVLLMPGWLALLNYYLFNSLIIKNIEYGKGSRYRNVLDIYLPPPHNPIHGKKENKYENGVPVVVFVSGGAWIIGYKLWSALMGREFARRGYVVVVPDYRNFPQGNIEDMIVDLKEALRWTVCNSTMFGGDPKKIVLAGQSAGAHISLCTIIDLYETYLKKLRKQNLNTSNNKFKQNNSDLSTFPHVNTATVLISSSLCLNSSSSSSTPSPSSSSSSSLHSVENQINSNQSTQQQQQQQQNASSSSVLGENTAIWWDVDTPKTINKHERPSSPSGDGEGEGEGDDDHNTMEILWDNDNQNSEYIEPLSDGPKSPMRKSFSSPIDNLQEILTPFSSSTPTTTTNTSQYHPIPSPAALPLEINLLGSTEYASDVINDTAKHNVDESIHDLDITDISMFIGISGPYNMVKLLQHLHFRGLDASILHHVFNSNVSHYSPVQRLNRLLHTTLSTQEDQSTWDDDENILKQTYNQFYSYLFNVRSTSSSDMTFVERENYDQSLPFLSSLINFPQVALFHGGKDQSIPSTVCDELTKVLLKGQVAVTSKIYPKMSHTDPILENVLAGETYLINDMTKIIEEKYSNKEYPTTPISPSSPSPSSPSSPNPSPASPSSFSSSNTSFPTLGVTTKERKNHSTSKTTATTTLTTATMTTTRGGEGHEAPVMVSRKLIYFARIMNPF